MVSRPSTADLAGHPSRGDLSRAHPDERIESINLSDFDFWMRSWNERVEVFSLLWKESQPQRSIPSASWVSPDLTKRSGK
jgi:hypothetical protein